MSHLVIVESPAKGKTIEKYLGKDYIVKASLGHVRDLPEKKLGVDIDKGFEPEYLVDDDKKKVISELKKLAKAAESVIIATDEDREGESIGWHLCQALGLPEKTTQRIVFHEITKGAIQKAIESPRHIDMNLVNAQQSRRILDRIVGYQVSPVLWKKVRKGLSAGRVQSVAVRLIVEKEREINAFVPTESWRLRATVEYGGATFPVELHKEGGKIAKPKTEADARKLLADLGADMSTLEKKEDKKKGVVSVEAKASVKFTLQDVATKETKRTPGAPFTTSTLQQEASRKLGWGVKQTMNVAQVLYQAGMITYMRTDSVHLSEQAIAGALSYVESEFGKEYAVSGGRQYKTGSKGAQEAHEAIRPTDFSKRSTDIDFDDMGKKLYKLIWERTVASQMKEADVETTTYMFTPSGANQEWVAKGEVIKFAGFMKLYIEGTDEENEEEGNTRLPAITVGTVVDGRGVTASQVFSRPPARYTEAALVKKLESEGIGRPSTYAPTISTIIDRGYVEKEKKYLKPTELAFTVNDFLVANFTKMMDYGFTAAVEQEFDDVATGNLEWRTMLGNFYVDFKVTVEAAGGVAKVQELVGRKCPKCGEGDLVYKFSKSGKFIGCNKYPDCDFLENITDPAVSAYMEQLKAEWEGKPCPEGGTIVVRNGRFGPFLSSSEYPKVKWIGKVPSPKTADLEKKFGGGVCDKCGEGRMVVRSSRRGPFLSCNRYPDCKNAKPLPKQEQVDEGTSDVASEPLPPEPGEAV